MNNDLSQLIAPKSIDRSASEISEARFGYSARGNNSSMNTHRPKSKFKLENIESDEEKKKWIAAPSKSINSESPHIEIERAGRKKIRTNTDIKF